MKIAKVFLDDISIEENGESFWKLHSGRFLDRRFANGSTPFFIVALPITRTVLPVVYCHELPDKAAYFSTIYDFSEMTELGQSSDARGWEPGDGEFLPVGSELLVNPAKHYAVLLKLAREYWRPLTAKPYAVKLYRFLSELSKEHYNEMVHCIGMRATKSYRKKMFVCLRWHLWAEKDTPPAEREADALKHGFEMKEDAISKLAKRLGLGGIKDLKNLDGDISK